MTHAVSAADATRPPSLSRRGLLRTLAAAAPLLAVAQAGPVSAAAPAGPLPSIYPRPLGSGSILAVADGFVTLPAQFVAGLSDAEIEAAQRAAYAPDVASITAPITSWVVRLGTRTVLIDGGAGTMFVPTAGRFAMALKAAGLTPADVTDVLVTHVHPDHVGGLLDGAAAVFRTATVHLPAGELAFWSDRANAGRVVDPAKPFFDVAALFVAAYRDRFAPFTGERDIVPGIRSLSLPGHTPAHHGYQVSDGAETVLVAGDAVVFSAFQFRHPAASSLVDFDARQAVETRRRLLDRAVADRVPIAGTHLPFPGFGRVEARADGAYAWVPESWKLG